jgi:hypothetical protein
LAEKQPERVLKAEQVVETALDSRIALPKEVATVETVGAVELRELEVDVHNLHKLREAIILREILDKPLALR